MRLQSLRLENYRGYNEAREIPLDSRVLLFYGQNGRGKSSVFGALEMALFPEEKIAELRREYGSQEAPLTNRFNADPVGQIELSVAHETEQLIKQPVLDRLDRIPITPLPLHRTLSGHRRRIFFTQELLRDLMLGSPNVRYRRLSELLGCDAYDRLIALLQRWSVGPLARVREQSDSLRMLEDVRRDIAAYLEEQKLESLLAEFLNRQLHPDVADWFVQTLRRRWEEADPELAQFVAGEVEGESAQQFAVGAAAALSRLHTWLLSLSVRRRPPIRRAVERVPLLAWRKQLLELHQRWEQAAKHLAEQEAALQAVKQKHKTEPGAPKITAEYIRQSVLRIRAENRRREAEKAWTSALLTMQSRAKRMRSEAEAAEYLLPRIAHIQDRTFELADRKDRLPESVEQMEALIAQRSRLAHGVRYLYEALLDLTHAELVHRKDGLLPLWKQYYGQISSHAHFQDLDVEIRQRAAPDDPIAAALASPFSGRTVRFMVSDPAAKKQAEGGLPIQSLLSEGQLNCAVVAMALALSEVQAPPLKLIALDDPFVSWDDVNMENFLAAVRDLVRNHWTVMLSTCDERVVTSFRRNMETLGEEFPGMVYTFRDWDRERGPQIDRARLPSRQTRHLRDLPSEVCEREPLAEVYAPQPDPPPAEADEIEADVWIVPLSHQPIEPGHPLTFRDIPFERKRYYYPATWPRRLRTRYMGFRFDGHLQAIARIVRTRTIPNFDAEIPGLTAPWADKPHVVVELADFEPWPRMLKSGPIYNRHAYCDFDLLESSQTVMEADRLSAERRRKQKA